MVEKTYCVYQIYNKVKDKSYIGCTCYFDGRNKEENVRIFEKS